MQTGFALGFVVIAFAATSSAYAQPQTSSRAAVTIGTGAAASPSFTGATIAGSISFDLSQQLSIETEGRYLDRGPGAEALNASAALIVQLRRPTARMVPFALAGAGVHRATFNLNHPQLLGNARAAFQPGETLCSAMGTGFQHHAAGWHQGSGWPHQPGTGPHVTPIEGMPCAEGSAGHWGMDHMPEFYARRMGTMTVPQNGVWRGRAFTDPMMMFGGGLKLRTIGRVSVRADARALLLFDGGATHTIGVFGFNVGYRF